MRTLSLLSLLLFALVSGGCESVMFGKLIITEKQLNSTYREYQYRYIINNHAHFYSDENFEVGDTLK